MEITRGYENRVTVDATTLEAVREMLPPDMRSVLAAGDVVWRTSRGGWFLLSTPNDRAGYACGGDSQWGHWSAGTRSLDLDDGGGRLDHDGLDLCPWSDSGRAAYCARHAIDHDHDGDAACEFHAAQSEDWLVVLDGETWTDEEGAKRIAGWLEERGWEIELRQPRARSEAPGIYYRRNDGSWQITGYGHRTPESLTSALHDAGEQA